MIMRIILRLSCWAITIVILASACNTNGDLTAMRQVDRDFVLRASEANLAQIQLAEIAVTRATTSAVLSFANQMATEHRSALDELEELAEDKNTAITRSINLDHQEIEQKLSIMNGYTFDTAYMKSQILDHEKIIALFETEISNGNDPKITDYALQYLPDIQRNHDRADSISRLLDQ